MGLSGYLQESLLSLLCFDSDAGKRIASIVPIDAWDGAYRLPAVKATEYWRRYKEAPGDQALDLFEESRKDDKPRAKQYRELLQSLQETRGTVNSKYVLDKVTEFLSEQRLRRGIIEAVDCLEQGKPKDAEEVVRKSLSGILDVFNPGLLFHKVDLNEVLVEDRQPIPTGIKELDMRGLGPAAGELHLFIGPPNSGKSWWLIHLAKTALANRKRVVYVTLEMDERRIAQRLIQTFCAISKRREEIVTAVFEENELGQLIGIEDRRRESRLSFEDDDAVKKVSRKMKKFARRSPLVVRQFPTGALTIRELRAYLDSLEAQQGITPDLLLVDYADLMSLDTKNYRIDLGTLYKELRGLAVERNIAIATACQTNRDSAGRKDITGRGVAEDFSKIGTCDTILTYNQTEAEHKRGLARIYVDKGRYDEGKFKVLIAQSYATGQFCLASRRMASQSYWRALEDGAEKDSNKSRKRERL